jgi:hypothetical protein
LAARQSASGKSTVVLTLGPWNELGLAMHPA